MVRSAVAVAAAAILVSGAARAGTMRADDFGCRSMEDARKFLSLIVARDFEAADAFSLRTELSGACRKMRKGTKGVIEDTAVLRGMVCVRPAGDPDCYWVGLTMFMIKDAR